MADIVSAAPAFSESVYTFEIAESLGAGVSFLQNDNNVFAKINYIMLFSG